MSAVTIVAFMESKFGSTTATLVPVAVELFGGTCSVPVRLAEKKLSGTVLLRAVT